MKMMSFMTKKDIRLFIALLGLALAGEVRANLLTNPGFEAGVVNGSLSNIVAWTNGWDYKNAGEILDNASEARSGSRYLKLIPDTNYYLNRSISQAILMTNSGGRVVQLRGWLKTCADQVVNDDGVVMLQMSFSDKSGNSVGNLYSPWVNTSKGLGTNWTEYMTQPFIVPTNTAKVYVTCNYSGGRSNTPGTVCFDDISLEEIPVPSAGALLNPGFELMPVYPLSSGNIPPCWKDYGNAFGVVSNVAHSGQSSLGIWYGENLVGQDFPATPGARYEVAGYMASFTGTYTNSTFGSLILCYLNAAGVQIGASALSEKFTRSSPTNVWIPVSASAVAPVGTVTARLFCAVTGGKYLGGTILFDDLTQRVVSAGGSVSGLLLNPGFDDGITGNAYTLAGSGNLPHWQWASGTNAGFIVDTWDESGDQSLALTWPGNYAYQDFAVLPGEQYVISGYLFTPSGADQLSSDGMSYGALTISYFVGGEPVPLNTTESGHFTADCPADTWLLFCVTSTVPLPDDPDSAVTGRLSCAIGSATFGEDFAFGGIICFDSLSVVHLAREYPPAYSGWLMNVFGSTNGALLGMTQDYDADGFDNWSEFIAGTDPANKNSRFSLESAKVAGEERIVLSWPSCSGRFYRILGTANPLLTGFNVVENNIPSTPPVNSYTSTPPASLFYYRIEARTNLFE